MTITDIKRICRGSAVRPLAASAMLAAIAMASFPAWAACPPVPLTQRTIESPYDFPGLVDRLEQAIKANGMVQIAKASASAAAAGRGVKIPGDAVLMVFRNDFAVRMLHANVSAGLEAPIPVHVFETAGGKASLAYRLPSTLFKAYCNRDLDTMASELDGIFDHIATDAVKNEPKSTGAELGQDPSGKAAMFPLSTEHHE